MTALVAVGTMIIRIPNPMGGYFNVGDAMIFIAALTFNPLIGGIAGGLGSAIADMIGFPLFVIPTLIIKGLEGFIASLVSNKKEVYRDLLAVVIAGIEMISGYFLVEAFILGWGIEGALLELPGNVAQIVVGGIIGVPIALVLRRRLSEIIKI
jgi:uncharacterized membrane protein